MRVTFLGHPRISAANCCREQFQFEAASVTASGRPQAEHLEESITLIPRHLCQSKKVVSSTCCDSERSSGCQPLLKFSKLFKAFVGISWPSSSFHGIRSSLFLAPGDKENGRDSRRRLTASGFKTAFLAIQNSCIYRNPRFPY